MMALQPIVKRLSRDAVAVAEILVVRERERERETDREQLTTFSCRRDGVKILNRSAAAEIFGGMMCGTSVGG